MSSATYAHFESGSEWVLKNTITPKRLFDDFEKHVGDTIAYKGHIIVLGPDATMTEKRGYGGIKYHVLNNAGVGWPMTSDYKSISVLGAKIGRFSNFGAVPDHEPVRTSYTHPTTWQSYYIECEITAKELFENYNLYKGEKLSIKGDLLVLDPSTIVCMTTKVGIKDEYIFANEDSHWFLYGDEKVFVLGPRILKGETRTDWIDTTPLKLATDRHVYLDKYEVSVNPLTGVLTDIVVFDRNQSIYLVVDGKIVAVFPDERIKVRLIPNQTS